MPSHDHPKLTGHALKVRFGVKKRQDLVPKKISLWKTLKIKVTKWGAHRLPLPPTPPVQTAQQDQLVAQQVSATGKKGKRPNLRYDEIIPRTNTLGSLYLGSMVKAKEDKKKGQPEPDVTQMGHIIDRHLATQKGENPGQVYVFSVTLPQEHALEKGTLFRDWKNAGASKGVTVNTIPVPMEDFSPNIVPEHILHTIYKMRKIMEENPNNTIYIHCKAGKARSALMVAALVSAFGKDFNISFKDPLQEEANERYRETQKQLERVEMKLALLNGAALKQQYQAYQHEVVPLEAELQRQKEVLEQLANEGSEAENQEDISPPANEAGVVKPKNHETISPVFVEQLKKYQDIEAKIAKSRAKFNDVQKEFEQKYDPEVERKYAAQYRQEIENLESELAQTENASTAAEERLTELNATITAAEKRLADFDKKRKLIAEEHDEYQALKRLEPGRHSLRRNYEQQINDNKTKVKGLKLALEETKADFAYVVEVEPELRKRYEKAKEKWSGKKEYYQYLKFENRLFEAQLLPAEDLKRRFDLVYQERKALQTRLLEFDTNEGPARKLKLRKRLKEKDHQLSELEHRLGEYGLESHYRRKYVREAEEVSQEGRELNKLWGQTKEKLLGKEEKAWQAEYQVYQTQFQEKRNRYQELEKRITRPPTLMSSNYANYLQEKKRSLLKVRRPLVGKLATMERLGLDKERFIIGPSADYVQSKRPLVDLHQKEVAQLGNPDLVYHVEKAGKLQRGQKALDLHSKLIDDLNQKKLPVNIDTLIAEYDLYMKRPWPKDQVTPTGSSPLSTLEYKNEISETDAFQELIILSLDETLDEDHRKTIQSVLNGIYYAEDDEWMVGSKPGVAGGLSAWVIEEQKQPTLSPAQRRMLACLTEIRTDAEVRLRQVQSEKSEMTATSTQEDGPLNKASNKAMAPVLEIPPAQLENPTAKDIQQYNDIADQLQTMLATMPLLWEKSKHRLHSYTYDDNKVLRECKFPRPVKAMMELIDKARSGDEVEYSVDNTMETCLKQVIATALLESVSEKNSDLEHLFYQAFSELIDVDATIQNLSELLRTASFPVRTLTSKDYIEGRPGPKYASDAYRELDKMNTGVKNIAMALKALQGDQSTKWDIHLFRRPEVNDFYNNIGRHLVLKKGNALEKEGMKRLQGRKAIIIQELKEQTGPDHTKAINRLKAKIEEKLAAQHPIKPHAKNQSTR